MIRTRLWLVLLLGLVSCNKSQPAPRQAEPGVVCWGNKQFSPLKAAEPGTHVMLPALKQAEALVTVNSTTCAKLASGWQCEGSAPGAWDSKRREASDLMAWDAKLRAADVRGYAFGTLFTCLIRASGGAECWGNNLMGQLGRGPGTDLSTPVMLQVNANGDVEPLGELPEMDEGPGPVTGVKNAVAIGAGSSHACALEGDGTVKCWGSNAVGQLGQGTQDKEPNPTPMRVPGVNAKALAVEERYTCVLDGEGAVRCWGSLEKEDYGGKQQGQSSPMKVEGLAAAAQLEVGKEQACAVTRGGDVFCWMHPDYKPWKIKLPGKSQMVSVGSWHACAVGEAGEVWCWGQNDLGQLGVEDSELRGKYGEPVKVPLDGKAVSISGRSGHVCVIQKP